MIFIQTIQTKYFDELVQKNKSLNRPWYFGLPDSWWHGWTEDQVRDKLISDENQSNTSLALSNLPNLNYNLNIRYNNGKIAVCTLNGDYVDWYAKYTSINFLNYCNINNYDFIEQQGAIDKSRHPTWSKVILVNHILHIIPKYDWVMWIDADAVITNKLIKIEDIIKNNNYNYDIIIAKENCCDFHINAGVFLVKNSEWSINFLNKWYSQIYWMNKALYDNSAIIYLHKTFKDVQNHVKLVKQRLLNSFIYVPGRGGQEGIWKEGDFICHYAGVTNRESLKWLGYHKNPYWIRTRDELPSLLNKLNLNNLGVEIGVEKGLYSEILLSHSNLKTLYLVDTWKHDQKYNDPCNVSDTMHEQKFLEANIRLKKFITTDKAKIIRTSSNEASKIFNNESLDFVYIDANHQYSSVMQDLTDWYPKVKSGGLISGHDFMDDNTKKGMYGVRRALTDFLNNIKYKGEIFITPEKYPTWYLIK